MAAMSAMALGVRGQMGAMRHLALQDVKHRGGVAADGLHGVVAVVRRPFVGQDGGRGQEKR